MLDQLTDASGTWLWGSLLMTLGLYSTYTSNTSDQFPVSNMVLLSTGALLIHESQDGLGVADAMGKVVKNAISLPGA